MDTESGKLTVFFEGPFWVGVFERVAEGKLSACKVTFGAEPSYVLARLLPPGQGKLPITPSAGSAPPKSRCSRWGLAPAPSRRCSCSGSRIKPGESSAAGNSGKPKRNSALNKSSRSGGRGTGGIDPKSRRFSLTGPKPCPAGKAACLF